MIPRPHILRLLCVPTNKGFSAQSQENACAVCTYVLRVCGAHPPHTLAMSSIRNRHGKSTYCIFFILGVLLRCPSRKTAAGAAVIPGLHTAQAAQPRTAHECGKNYVRYEV